MAELSPEKKKQLRSLFEQNGLTNDDVFQHRHFVIITRSGIEKIQAKHKLHVQFDVIKMEPDWVVLQAICTRRRDEHPLHQPALRVQTFGEAGPENCKNAYYVATAEKRALSRAVLKFVGMYQHGVYGEDEQFIDG